MKNILKAILTFLLALSIHTSSISQDTVAIRTGIDELFKGNYSSIEIRIENKTKTGGININNFSLNVDKNLTIIVYEFENYIENNCRKKLSGYKIHLVKLANAEFTTSNFNRNDMNGVAASVVVNLLDENLYNLLTMYYRDNLLFEFIFLTTEQEVSKKVKKLFSLIYDRLKNDIKIVQDAFSKINLIKNGMMLIKK